MPGVKAILTADDMPGAAVGATLGEGVQASAQAERGLTNEPLYEGEPILAVAAIDEKTAAEAIEAIVVDFEPLPFVVDPIESLRPNGAERAHAGQRLDASGDAAGSTRCTRRGQRRARRAQPAPARRHGGRRSRGSGGQAAGAARSRALKAQRRARTGAAPAGAATGSGRRGSGRGRGGRCGGGTRRTRRTRRGRGRSARRRRSPC